MKIIRDSNFILHEQSLIGTQLRLFIPISSLTDFVLPGKKRAVTAEVVAPEKPKNMYSMADMESFLVPGLCETEHGLRRILQFG